MDELIKFLPIVLYLVYRAFSAGKGKEEKPKPRPVQQKKPQKQPSSIEDILRELRQEVLQEEPEYAPVVTKKQKPAKIKIEDHQYDFVPEYEHHGKKGKSLSKIRLEIAEDQNNVLVDFDTDNINLRQAVIYDAILNRPEY